MATKQDGFYCSTSGTYFSDKESLAEHYKSDFHRYNLKRKVAGLPPVTKDWFEARKAQLTSATTTAHQKIWFDPLTKKKFQTQNTYQAHVNSKKYQELVKQSGQPAPAPIIMIKQLQEEGTAVTNGAAPKAAAPAGYTVKAPHPKAAAAVDQDDDEYEETGSDAEDNASGWETASEEDDEDDAAAAQAGNSRGLGTRRQQQAAAGDDGKEDDEEAAVPEEDWVKWNVCVSLFDNKRSSSMQDNLEYMFKHFGFYLPDSEYLDDPEGLLQYLGAKLQYGKVPIYTAGDDPNAKQFRSLHAVQRHMVDTNQCKMLYDGNEEEYEDFYDYSKPNNTDSAGGAEAADSIDLALATTGFSNLDLGSSKTAGWELAVAGGVAGSAAGNKTLGSRELAKYYRQRPKPFDSRQSVAVNSIVAQYRSLGIVTKAHDAPADVKRAQKEKQRQQRQWLNLAMRTNINNNLPKNVPY